MGGFAHVEEVFEGTYNELFSFFSIGGKPVGALIGGAPAPWRYVVVGSMLRPRV